MLKKVWSFVKNPIYIEQEGSLQEKIKFFFILAVIAIATSLALGFLIESISGLVGFNFENHAVLEMFDTMPSIVIFFAAVIIAPLFEELIFRAPLGLFRKSAYFKYAFYISVFLFGLIHITNFENIDGYYWLIPVLIAPQLFAGFYLGFIRVKLGLIWSILLHAVHNLALIGPFIVMKMLDIPFE